MLSVIYNVSYIFDSILIYIFFQTIFGQKNNIHPIIIIVCISLSQVFYVFLTNFLLGDVSQTATYYRMILNIIINFMLTFFFVGSFFKRIFAVICYLIIILICEDLTYYIISHITDATVKFDTLSESSFMAINLICQLMNFLFISILHVVLKRKEQIHSFTYTVLILLIPTLSLVLPLLPSSFYLRYTTPKFYITLVIFLLIINITNYILLNNVLKAESLEQTTKQLNNQITYQQQKYIQLSEAYRNIRGFMHDTKKHLFYIEKCVKDKEFDRIIPYSKETMKDLESRYCKINTGNLVIDAFISNYILQTAQHGIDFKTNLKIDCNSIPIDDYHLTIILGNLLDNALNACLNQNFGKINIAIQTVENTFTIYITNTYIIPPDEKPPKNIEEIDFIHGYGLKNVKDSVSIYDGITLINYEKSIYSVTVILPLKSVTPQQVLHSQK